MSTLLFRRFELVLTGVLCSTIASVSVADPIQGWTSQRSGGTASLRNVSMYDGSTAYVVGTEETVLAYDGNTWASTASPPWPGTSDELLFAVNVIAPNQVIVGAWTPQRQASVYDGTTWSELFDAGPNNDRIADFWSDSDTGLIVSSRNVGRITTHTSGTITDDNNWSRQLSLSGTFYDVDGSSANNIWSVGSNGLAYRSTDGAGTVWNSVSVPAALNNQDWNAITVLSETEAWMVGADGAIAYWDGNLVTQQTSNTTQDLQGVYALDSDTVYAVGLNGTILEYNGSVWSSVSLPFVVTENLYRIDGTDSQVLIVGDNERIISGVVPEPGSFSLLGGFCGMLLLRRQPAIRKVNAPQQDH